LEGLAALLPPAPDRAALARLPDERALAEMARRVFSAGFAWSVIEAKRPGFEAAFQGFSPARFAFEPDDNWGAPGRDARIVRNGAKIRSVRRNAAFVLGVAREHGSFGAFLAAWPSSDEVGLLDLIARRGDRLAA